jgi:hypothetical protein
MTTLHNIYEINTRNRGTRSNQKVCGGGGLTAKPNTSPTALWFFLV